ncbi:diiron oxygenase [Pseudomonas sp. R5(2019)]|uniref:diiron oxygenase n=1 Tax=Pseudomonas sp. R5(2019) TaxID=2697566 RepID=UPI0014121904|nr:diiron oxygenase [Pseudomonas sp. R5(2019)]NBA94050.1 diiron oxygenase [Pseudomonas sp. R5(2019)]
MRINLPSSFIVENWDTRSSVRSRKNQYYLTQEVLTASDTKDWFPTSMLPFLQTPIIQCSSIQTQKALQASYLVHFLDYTTELEHKVVNRALEILIHDELEITLPESWKQAGLQLYTDEAYHALFSHQLSEQISKLFNIQRTKSIRLTKLADTISSTSEDNLPLLMFIVGFISETLIAKELLNISQQQVIRPVLSMFIDHLQDEARHAKYFSACFTYVWQKLQPDRQAYAASILPKLIKIFCLFDENWLLKNLKKSGFPDQTAKEVLFQIPKSNNNLNNMKSMLETLRNNGVFKAAQHRDFFDKEGIIVDEP